MPFAMMILANGIFLLFVYFFSATQPFLTVILGLLVFTLIGLNLHRQNRQKNLYIKTMEHGLLSFNDSDFSIGLPENSEPALQKLYALFNQTSEKLRTERQRLYQREMLLDTVFNASPIQTLLVDHRDIVVFANNDAVRVLFRDQKKIVGEHWSRLVTSLPEALQDAFENQQEAIITLHDDNSPQAWHLSVSSVRIHQVRHRLYLLKSITGELSKQEIATWKKVISVLSHELNNSIAPISSMCHSGKLLAKNLDEPRLDRVFSSIRNRIRHLDEFIKGYASLTWVQEPRKSVIDWNDLLLHLKQFYSFRLISKIPRQPLSADQVQLEQVLINILKNAHEADPEGEVTLSINSPREDKVHIEIIDHGTGMSPEVLKNALLPFYSTKHSGTGLGLALCREIIEAHQGKLIFQNIEEGGLSVSIILPANRITSDGSSDRS